MANAEPASPAPSRGRLAPVALVLGLVVLIVAAAFGAHWYLGTYRPAQADKAQALAAFERVRKAPTAPLAPEFSAVEVTRAGDVCGEVRSAGGQASVRAFMVRAADGSVLLDSGASGLARDLCLIERSRSRRVAL